MACKALSAVTVELPLTPHGLGHQSGLNLVIGLIAVFGNAISGLRSGVVLFPEWS